MEINLPFLLCFTLYLRATSKYKPPPGGGGAYIWRGDLTRGFLRYEFRALILGGAHFPGFYGIFLTSRPRENSIIAGRVTRRNKSFEHIKTIS